jgi:hypothetical protein
VGEQFYATGGYGPTERLMKSEREPFLLLQKEGQLTIRAFL